MNVEMTTRIIQLILAPVVMITSCALVLGGLLGRYAAVNDRLRTMARERLDLLRPTADAQPFQAERLKEIDLQIPDLLSRHTLLHHAALTTYCAVLLFIVSMFVIAFAALSDSAWIATTVLLLFLGGTAALFLGVLIAVVEVWSSHRAVQFEIRRVSALSILERKE